MMVCSAGGAGCPDAGGAGCAAACSTITFCCSFDLRLPCACAFARMRWMASMVSFLWSRKASPSFCIQSIFSFKRSRVWGKLHSDFTLSSQSCFLSSSLSAASLRFGLDFMSRAAWITSSG